MHPLEFHLALIARNAHAKRAHLERPGATFFAEDALPDGSIRVIMRHPWGVPIQLCQLPQPFPMP